MEKIVDFLWRKVRNTGILKGNEPKNQEFFRPKIWKLHGILEGLADFQWNSWGISQFSQISLGVKSFFNEFLQGLRCFPWISLGVRMKDSKRPFLNRGGGSGIKCNSPLTYYILHISKLIIKYTRVIKSTCTFKQPPLSISFKNPCNLFFSLIKIWKCKLKYNRTSCKAWKLGCRVRTFISYHVKQY